MNADKLVQQAVGMPEKETRERFLEERIALLGDESANALKAQADQFLRSDVHRSLEAAQLLLYQAELTGDPLHRALGLLAEANARSIGLGESQFGIGLYDEAASIYQVEGCPAREARSQIGKLFALTRLGRHEEALQTGEWASSVLEDHAQWRPLADLTLNLGIIHSRLGQDVESLARYDQARALYQRLGAEGEPFLPWVDHDRAIALRNLGRFEASIQAAQSAMETLVAQGQRVEAGRAQQNLALTYFVLGRYNEALALYEQVRDVFLADGRQRDASLVDLFTCDCLLQLRRFSQVVDLCRQARERFAGLGARFEAGQALLNEAVAYAGLGRNDAAMDALAGARRAFIAEGNEVWIACTDLEMAAMLLRQDRFKESAATTEACLHVFQARGLPVREAQAHLVAARALVALAQDDQARHHVDQALTEAKQRDIPSLAYQGHHLLGTLAEAGGDVEKAMAEYDLAIRELERLRGRLMVEFRADFVEDKQRIYDDMVELCLDTSNPLQALEYAERAKSRALLDLLAYRLDLRVQARTEDDRPLVEELTRLRAKRDQLYRRWEGRDPSEGEDWTAADEHRQQTRRDVLALETQITDLWHRILIRNADYARDASLWKVRTEAVQPYLEPETLLLEYFVSQERLVAFLVSEQEIEVHRFGGDLGQVQNLLQLLWLNLRAVAGRPPAQTANLARNAIGLLQRLHEHLVEPLAKALANYPKLIIVPHGPLHYLPFHALHDGASYLLGKHGISYLPAASLLRYCRQARPAHSGAFVLGHSYGGRLPHTIGEARLVAAHLDSQAWLEEDATLERLRKEAPNCQAIHLAAHGDFRPDNPLFSGLALDDGWLTTLDIFDMRLRASLVTLSACQTGRSVVGGGDEVQGLMRAFIQAGAASVVLTLWAVEDRATASLMKTFYRKLAEGWTKGAALRFAQQKLAAECPTDEAGTTAEVTHPYFWAPFFLVGDAGPL